MPKRLLTITFFVLFVYLFSCSSEESDKSANTPTTPPSMAAQSSVVAPGSQCVYGGVRIDSGIDDNRNGVLDPEEVDNTDYVCNGSDGVNSLTIITEEAAGDNCVIGGLKIEVGLDNGDGLGTENDEILQPGEVDITTYLCRETASSKDITSFYFTASANNALTVDVLGSIVGTDISVDVPFGTDVSGLIASFTTNGAVASIGGIIQSSGSSVNDFSNTVTYTVTAADSTSKDYHVSVMVGQDDGNQSGTTVVGSSSFSLDSYHVQSENMALDQNDDLILEAESLSYSWLWMANSNDVIDGEIRGTVSKIDTSSQMESARYLSFSCSNSDPSYGNCRDVNDNSVQVTTNSPSRVAVDHEGNAWVVNSASGGQASITKIAFDNMYAVDRDTTPGIQSSTDVDQNGRIDTTNPLEFVGLDDEAVLFTVNFGSNDYLGNSIGLDSLGNAWLGTFKNAPNIIYKVAADGSSITEELSIVSIPIFNIVIDRYDILWATDRDAGYLFYLNTRDTSQQGLIKNPNGNKHYGICLDQNQYIFLTGWDSKNIYKFKPDRNIDGVPSGAGDWSEARFNYTTDLGNAAVIVVDNRGYIWTSHSGNGGYVSRISASLLPDGVDLVIVDETKGIFVDAKSSTDGTTGEALSIKVDHAGHVWVACQDTNKIRKIYLSDSGDPSGIVTDIPIGNAPFTPNSTFSAAVDTISISKFASTGSYKHMLKPCDEAGQTTQWGVVNWTTSLEQNSNIELYFRASDDINTIDVQTRYGPWSSNSINISDHLIPETALFLELEFVFTGTGLKSSRLQEFSVSWQCVSN